MFRFLTMAGFLGAVILPAPVRAADPALAAKDGPTFLVRFQSINQLLTHAEFIAGLIGKEESAKQWLGFLRLAIGDKGLEGVDVKNPFIIYGYLDQDIINGVVVAMIPVADQQTIMAQMKSRLGAEVKDEKEGLFSTAAPNGLGTVYFRFANNYAYLTYANKKNIDVLKLVKPGSFGPANKFLSISLRVDRLPEQVKTFILGAIENQLARGKERKLPIDTPGSRELRDKSIDGLVRGLKAFLVDGQELSADIDIDEKQDRLGLELSMTPRQGSELARDLAAWKQRQSVVFGDFSPRDPALVATVDLAAPPSIKAVLGPAVDDLVKAGLEALPEKARELGPLIKAAAPTLKSGDLNGGVIMIGPDAAGKFTALAGAKIVDGKQIEKAFKDVVQQTAEVDRPPIQFDADHIGSTNLHLLKPRQNVDPNSERIFGTTEIWFAFRDNAVFAVSGPGAKTALTRAIASRAAPAPLIRIDAAVARLFAASGEKLHQEAIKKIFGGGQPRDDALSLSIEAGELLRVRFAVRGKVVKLLSEIDRAKNEGGME